MSGLIARKARPAQAQEPERDASLCYANGCPLRGTIDRGNAGRFLCVCHDGKEAHEWPRITEKAHEFRWLAEFIFDVQRLATTTARPAMNWDEFAARFWQDSDQHCMPSTFEAKFPQRYAYRMLGELRWRCGSETQRPNPAQEPAYRKAGGNMAQLMAGDE